MISLNILDIIAPKNKLLFLDKNSRVHDDIDEVFKRKLDLGKNKGEYIELR